MPDVASLSFVITNASFNKNVGSFVVTHRTFDVYCSGAKKGDIFRHKNQINEFVRVLCDFCCVDYFVSQRNVCENFIEFVGVWNQKSTFRSPTSLM